MKPSHNMVTCICTNLFPPLNCVHRFTKKWARKRNKEREREREREKQNSWYNNLLLIIWKRSSPIVACWEWECHARTQEKKTDKTDGQMDKGTDRQTEDGGVAILDKRELGLHITRLLVMTWNLLCKTKRLRIKVHLLLVEGGAHIRLPWPAHTPRHTPSPSDSQTQQFRCASVQEENLAA